MPKKVDANKTDVPMYKNENAKNVGETNKNV